MIVCVFDVHTMYTVYTVQYTMAVLPASSTELIPIDWIGLDFDVYILIISN